MAQVKEKVETVLRRLVGVIWEDAIGVVDLTQGKVILIVEGKNAERFGIPVVVLEDEDFRLMVEEDDVWDDALMEAACWENVVALLTLSSFDLDGRLMPAE
jgi:hypothetical protein